MKRLGSLNQYRVSGMARVEYMVPKSMMPRRRAMEQFGPMPTFSGDIMWKSPFVSRHHCPHHLDFAAGGCAAHLAVQRGVGLLSVGWSRIGVGHSPHPLAHGTIVARGRASLRECG